MRLLRSLVYILSISVLLLLPKQVLCDTIFVSPNGDDNGSPLKTILRAVQVAKAGDEIVLLEGTHVINQTVEVGTMPLHFRAADPNTLVTLTGTTTMFKFMGTNLVTWSDLVFVGANATRGLIEGIDKAKIKVERCTFTTQWTRGMYLRDMDYIEIRGCKFIDIVHMYQSTTSYQSGCACDLEANTVIVAESLFQNITCEQRLIAPLAITDSKNVSVYDCTFDNVKALEGVPFGVYRSTGVTMSNLTISNSYGYIGAVFHDTIDVLVKDSRFYNNHATGESAAIYFLKTDATISNCVFINNTIDLSIIGGGATAALSSNVTFTDCYFEGSFAKFGSSIFAFQMDGLPYPNLVLKNVTVAKEKDTNSSIHCQGCNNVEITDVELVDIHETVHTLSLLLDSPTPSVKTVRNLKCTNFTWAEEAFGCLVVYATEVRVSNISINTPYDKYTSFFVKKEITVETATVIIEDQPEDIPLGGTTIHINATLDIRVPVKFRNLNIGALGTNNVYMRGVNVTVLESSVFGGGNLINDNPESNSWLIMDGAFSVCCSKSTSQPIYFERVNLLNRKSTTWGNQNVTFKDAEIVSTGYLHFPYYTPLNYVTAKSLTNKGTMDFKQMILFGDLISDGGTFYKSFSNYYAPEHLEIKGNVDIKNTTFIASFHDFRTHREPDHLQQFPVVRCGEDASICSFNFTDYRFVSGSGYQYQAHYLPNGFDISITYFQPIGVQIGSSLSSIIVNFARETNMANEKNCSAHLDPEALSFFDLNTLTCKWTSPTTLEISSSRLPHFFNLVMLAEGGVTDRFDPNFKNFATGWFPVLYYANQLTAVILTPLVIPACGEIVLDGSSSFGNGVYQLNYYWSLISNDTEDAELASYISSVNSSKLSIPSESLILGKNYSIQLTISLLDFYTHSQIKVIRREQSRMPPLRVEGPSERYHFANLPLVLVATVNLDECLLAEDIVVNLQWEQLSGPPIAPEGMIGTNLTTLVLLPGYLQHGSTYVFRITGTIEGSPLETSSAVVTVHTPPAPTLLLLVDGDGTQSVDREVDITATLVDPQNSSVSLDGKYEWALLRCPGELQRSSPNDLVEESVSTLSFASTHFGTNPTTTTNTTEEERYDCLYSNTSYGVGFNLRLDQLNTSRLSVPPGVLEPGIYSFGVSAYTPDGRTSYTVIYLHLTEQQPPRVQIVPPLKPKILAEERHEFHAIVDGVSFLDPRQQDNTIAVEWREVSGSGLDLDDRESVVATSKNSIPLVLHPGALVPGKTYIFELAAWHTESPELVSVNRKVVQVNSAPAGGKLEVTPTTGIAGKTKFDIATSGWGDEDLPLRYEFALVVDGVDYLLAPQSESSQLLGITLNVWSRENNTVAIKVTVTDIWGSFATLTTPVILTIPESINHTFDLAQRYASAADIVHFDNTVDALASWLSTDITAPQPQREALLDLVLQQVRAGIDDSAIRVLGHITNINKNGKLLANATLINNLSTKSMKVIQQILNSDFVSVGKSSKLAEHNSKLLLSALSQITSNQNVNETVNSTEIYNAAFETLDSLTSTMVESSIVGEYTSIPTNGVSLLTGKNVPQYLDGASLRASPERPQGFVTLPSGFGDILVNQVAARKRALSNEVRVQLVQWTAESFPCSSKAASLSSSSVTTQLHNYVLSLSIFDSLGERIDISNLNNPINITFNVSGLNNTMLTQQNVSCVWWNPNSDSWDESGCQLTKIDSELATCSCTHLTDFSLLFRFTAPSPPPPPASAPAGGNNNQNGSKNGDEGDGENGDGHEENVEENNTQVAGAVAAVIVLVGAAAAGGAVFFIRRRRMKREAKDIRKQMRQTTNDDEEIEMQPARETTWKVGERPQTFTAKNE